MFRKAIIVATNPGDNSVDLILCDDGSRISGVPVLCVGGSARSGSVGLPEIEGSDGGKGGSGGGGDKWDITGGRGKQIEAMVGFMGSGNPFVAGFMFPQISQMTFDDKKRSLSRHQSDVYHTTDGEGNTEFYHPSGAYVRIGEKTEHEDLENKNVDKSFKLDRNKDKKVKMHIQTKDGKGAVTLDPDGTVTIKAAVKIVLDTPLVSIPNGKLEASGDGTFGGVSVIKHLHKDTMPGAGMSGPPVGGVSEGGVAGGGGASSNGGAFGQPSDANTVSGPGNPETAGTYGNGIANDATGIFRGAIQTRVPFMGLPNIAGSGIAQMNFGYAWGNFPALPEKIGVDQFYERVRQTAVGIFDGNMYQALVSEFDQASETWTDDVIHLWAKDGEKRVDAVAGAYLGEIPGGIQAADQKAPFDVYVSQSGVHYVKYCDWYYKAYITNAVVVGLQPVFWKLTPEEVAENFVPKV
ncbi:hypothetical protein [Tardiphaga sp. 862_B3_N1_1]|uniref:hypothetical protein n=1 Tax=Tardiphaga sp. 862_B3_N1_1 TaxID=3240763 RepID=UPI003F8CA5C2